MSDPLSNYIALREHLEELHRLDHLTDILNHFIRALISWRSVDQLELYVRDSLGNCLAHLQRRHPRDQTRRIWALLILLFLWHT
jgi:hypothetical protein